MFAVDVDLGVSCERHLWQLDISHQLINVVNINIWFVGRLGCKSDCDVFMYLSFQRGSL
jgi:hypothetical protein